MIPDLVLIAALIFAILAITGFLTAWIEGTAPLRGLAFAIFSGALGYQAWNMSPDGIQFEDVPIAFMRIINEVIY